MSEPITIETIQLPDVWFYPSRVAPYAQRMYDMLDTVLKRADEYEDLFFICHELDAIAEGKKEVYGFSAYLLRTAIINALWPNTTLTAWCHKRGLDIGCGTQAELATKPLRMRWIREIMQKLVDEHGAVPKS